MSRFAFPIPDERRICEACGEPDHLHRHHVLPRSRGGTDRASNIVELCPGCHREAHGLYRLFGLCR